MLEKSVMRVLIIEDEVPAQINLERLLRVNFDDLEVVGTINSVKEAVRWLTEENQADIIFMDVELSDGMCFEIFKQVQVQAKVIITTAYNNYAIKAFKVNSIDYLLKPINDEELIEAVSRCRQALTTHTEAPSSMQQLLESLLGSAPKEYKQRFTVKLGDRIIIIDLKEVAYFYAEEKSTFIVTSDEKRYIIDQSLDMISTLLNPNQFFRLSRGYITAIWAIRSVSKHFSSRLKVCLTPKTESEVLVSRSRIPDFMRWLEDDLPTEKRMI